MNRLTNPISIMRYPLWLNVTLVFLGLALFVHLAAFIGYIEITRGHRRGTVTQATPEGRAHTKTPPPHGAAVTSSSRLPLRHLQRQATAVEANGAIDAPRTSQGHIPSDERRVNALVTQYDPVLKARMHTLVERRAGSREPEVIDLIRLLLDPPSKNMIKVRRSITTPQARVISEVLSDKRGGFFVECGALDGEHLSNTVALETELGWDGVLIEMDPFFYTQIRGKNRKAYTLNACLSPHDYVSEMQYVQSNLGLGHLLLESPESSNTTTPTMMVPCFPLESILLALNRTRVDFFSLDVEGFELNVLKTLPFDRLDISTLAVEYVRGDNKQAYQRFMHSQGYMTYKDLVIHDFEKGVFVDDFIFVKKSLVPKIMRRGRNSTV